MATLGDGFKGIFLAGIGAVAIGAEKGKELVDQLVARGEMTVEQGKQINTELKHRASNLESSIRRDTIEARMSVMSPDERVGVRQHRARNGGYRQREGRRGGG